MRIGVQAGTWLLAGLLLLGPLVAGGVPSPAGAGRALGQEANRPLLVPVELVSGAVDPGGAESMQIGVARLFLATGQATIPYVAAGAVFLLVEAGAVEVTADAPVVAGQNVDDGLGIQPVELTVGQRATVRPGTTVSFRNGDADIARLFLLAVVPRGGGVAAEGPSS